MSRFDLDNCIKEASSMDVGSLSSKQPRWQRKNDSQMYNSFNVSAAILNQTNDLLTNLTIANESNRRDKNLYRTPGKTPNSKQSSQTSNKIGLTPAKTPSRLGGGSQKSNLAKTPSGGADRYITNRNGMDMEKSHYLMTQTNKTNQENDPSLRDRLGANLDQYRIMCYTDKAPVGHEARHHDVAYSSSKTAASAKKINRVIPSQPEKILDAPDLVNDWYLNLVSWNSANILAVALRSSVYLWNAVSGETKFLFELPGNEHVCSVSWVQDGNHLAVGTSENFVEIWDCETQVRLRQMGGHSARVSALDWNSYTLTSGSKSGAIFHHDVRVAEHHVGTMDGHEGFEVCGLKWSPDGKSLASGANDNRVNVWSGSQINILQSENVAPVKSFAHQAAVKSMAWCPWKPHLLATGGGTTDRTIRVWNSTNGNCLHSVLTESQVSGLEWNEEYQELVSGHGYPNNTVNIWKYPSMTKVTELRGHQLRVLGLCLSPDRSTVVSLSADETLRFWECFPIDTQRKKKLEVSAKKTSINPIRMSLR